MEQNLSLRTLMAGMFAIALVLAVLTGPAGRQQAAVNWVQGLGGKVTYAGAPRHESRFIQKLQDLLPRDYFDTVTEIDLSATEATDDGFRHLRELKQIQKLYLFSTPVTDKGLGHLRHLETCGCFR